MVQDARQETFEQAKSITVLKYYNPATGLEMTKEAYGKMQEFIERQKQRAEEQKNRDRDGRDRDRFNR